MLYNFISRLLKSIRRGVHQKFIIKEIEFIIYKNGSYIQNEILFFFYSIKNNFLFLFYCERNIRNKIKNLSINSILNP